MSHMESNKTTTLRCDRCIIGLPLIVSGYLSNTFYSLDIGVDGMGLKINCNFIQVNMNRTGHLCFR